MKTDYQHALRYSLACLLIILSTIASAVEPVQAKLAKASAWTGEAVPLIITLYSPGPFSGTASFDVPELPQTAIILGGSPIVGSEAIDDETYFTQRHELTLFTQRNGVIEIPSFRVRFSGKKSFTSDPEPMEGLTPKLTFQSNRPPETENLGIVVAAKTMDVEQSWTPDSGDSLNAGDVLQRTITRQASGTTAMMMPPVSSVAPDGIRVYVSDPLVQDVTDRGTTTAQRNDTLKYQFERAGTFTIPESTIIWWDTDEQKLQTKVLAGKTISVQNDITAGQDVGEPEANSTSVTSLLVAAMTVIVFGGLAGAWMVRQKFRQQQPETLAARRLLSACNRNDASDAYAAFLDWKRIAIAQVDGRPLDPLMRGSKAVDECADLEVEVNRLTRRLYGNATSTESWSGKALGTAFSAARKALTANHRVDSASPLLPTLNPPAAHEV